MRIDSLDFPFVWLSYGSGASRGSDILSELERLLVCNDRFVLLSDDMPAVQDPPAADADERKRFMQWTKCNRSRLKRQVSAMIAIEGDAASRRVLKDFSGVFQKIWGYPLLVASTRDIAFSAAKLLLAHTGPARKRRR
ncbi:ATP--cob(I)alamin adenosyltransferase [Burkholderia multivorans]|uniref:ATP--cob(I)alamin adenosyltransferase n=1 Tax=Burkholderia multivorans TaxID=87883 RepID=UPI001C22D702|nr:ATP--cob(I)alamin adenosyltransferase [Burkholderia multivorans]MBU9553358.1 ATP--cob(I)alamin adenosyltransferase [Burkholderia multivorans]